MQSGETKALLPERNGFPRRGRQEGEEQGLRLTEPRLSAAIPSISQTRPEAGEVRGFAQVAAGRYWRWEDRAPGVPALESSWLEGTPQQLPS